LLKNNERDAELSSDLGGMFDSIEHNGLSETVSGIASRLK